LIVIISEIHESFGKVLCKTNNIPIEYNKWSTFPDIDLYDWHRYKYHRISSLPTLYSKCEDFFRYDKKYVSMLCIGHFYLDILSGPTKCFHGLNFTIHHKLLDLIPKYGYVETLKKVKSIIEVPNEYFIEAISNEFNEIDISDYKLCTLIMLTRLFEETLGNVDINREIEHLELFGGFSLQSKKEYEYNYSKFITMENNIIDSIEFLL